MTESLSAAFGPLLRSVILYGSAVAGDHTGRRSDVNVLVVLDRLGMGELKTVSPLLNGWVRAGNPPPLLFTPDGLRRAAAAFPLEIADLQDSHQVLCGDDLVRGLSVNREHLRRQLEHELNGKLIQLRQRYLLVAKHPRQVTELLIRSLSSCLVLLRGVLRLYQAEVPVKKLEALRALAQRLPLRIHVFEAVAHLKSGRRLPRVVPEQLFSEYVQAIESVVQAVAQEG